jgi:FtsH-binding integral membrane protein
LCAKKGDAMIELGKRNEAANAASVGASLSAVYQMMAAGIGLAGAVAFWTSTTPALMRFAATGIGAVAIIIAQLGLIAFIGKIVSKWGAQGGAVAFYVIAATMGLSLAPIAHAYTGASLARAFGLACIAMGVASFYGKSTKRSLASLGGLMFVGLIGLIIAAVVNIFLQSSWLQVVLDVVTIVVFTGLAAWDTQRIRDELEHATPAQAERIVVFGALSMWLNFVNLLTAFTSLTGDRE